MNSINFHHIILSDTIFLSNFLSVLFFMGSIQPLFLVPLRPLFPSWLLADDKTAAQRLGQAVFRHYCYFTVPVPVYITCIWHRRMFELLISIQFKYFNILGDMLINFLKTDEKIAAFSCLCSGPRAGLRA